MTMQTARQAEAPVLASAAPLEVFYESEITGAPAEASRLMLRLWLYLGLGILPLLLTALASLVELPLPFTPAGPFRELDTLDAPVDLHRWQKLVEGWRAEAQLFKQLTHEAPILLAALAALFVFITARLTWRARRFARGTREGHYQCLELSQVPTIRSLVSELCARMRIAEPPELWLSVDDSAVCPSLYSWKGRHHLILPEGLLVLGVADRLAVKAMLAHELGHVRQRDLQLWLLADILSGHVVRWILPTIAIVLVSAAAFNAHLSVLTKVSIVFCLLQLWRTRDAIGAARRRSEVLADFAASVFVGRDIIGRAIERYTRDAGRSFSHPAKAARLGFLDERLRHAEKLIAEYGDIHTAIQAERQLRSLSRRAAASIAILVMGGALFLAISLVDVLRYRLLLLLIQLSAN